MASQIACFVSSVINSKALYCCEALLTIAALTKQYSSIAALLQHYAFMSVVYTNTEIFSKRLNAQVPIIVSAITCNSHSLSTQQTKGLMKQLFQCTSLSIQISSITVIEK